jgi:hypothetical protein
MRPVALFFTVALILVIALNNLWAQAIRLWTGSFASCHNRGVISTHP